MQLGDKVLVLTLAITLGLSGTVVWVVSSNITEHETQRAHAAIQHALSSYFDRIDVLHKTSIARTVRLLMEGPQERALLEQIEFGDDKSKQFALAQLREEIFGRMVQKEVEARGIAPAFHLLLNDVACFRAHLDNLSSPTVAD